MMTVTASIVLYNNNYEIVEKAINSFFSNGDYFYKLLYLVDNSPSENLKTLCNINPENIHYIPSHNNPGYGTAHNIAIKKGIEFGCKYHLVLNPDVEFEQGVLETLFEFMEQNPDVGNVMPKILYKNGDLQRLCKLLPTPVNLFGRRFFKNSKWVERQNELYELESFNYDKIMEIPNLSGCFMFTRTSVLEKVGGFDERFFMYMEDMDLNRRIGEISKTVFYPYVYIVHGYEKESYKNKKLLEYHIKSAIKYFNKWGWIFDKGRKKKNMITIQAIV